MADEFIGLDPAEQAAIYRALSARLGRDPSVLQKDLWVCLVLKLLFEMPGRKRMAFKGGTSLSKVFGAIARFSEDIDVTIDYRELDSSFDPFRVGATRSQIRRYSDHLKDLVRGHVAGIIKPYLETALVSTAGEGCDVRLSEDGESLTVVYPTVLGPAGDYLSDSVLVEFGGRNVVDPNDEHMIAPDIAQELANLRFPRASVCVLSPSRTFWEKATLIHVACNRGAIEAGAARLSRHWYDLAMLADHAIGRAAIGDRALLEDVVRHKKVFFDSKDSNYDEGLSGRLKLVPREAAVAALRRDYEAMIGAAMFFGDPRPFHDIVRRLVELEQEINVA